MAGAPVSPVPPSSTAPVHINVGGKSYTSSLETLTKFPQSKLAKYFNGSLPITVDPLKNQYFFDRDGHTFRHILNFLRNSKLILPVNFGELELLLEEAIYFEIEDLCTDIRKSKEKINNKSGETEDNNSSCEETEDSINENATQSAKKRRKKKPKTKQNPKIADKNVEETTSEKDQDNDDVGKLYDYIDNIEINSSIEKKINDSNDHKLGRNDQNKGIKDKETEERKVQSITASLSSRNSELVCVETDVVGDVVKFTCAENFNFQDIFPLKQKPYIILYKAQQPSSNKYCYMFDVRVASQMCLCWHCKNYPDTDKEWSAGIRIKHDYQLCKNKETVGFPKFSQFLFNKNFTLISSLSIGGTSKSGQHFFMN